MVDVPSERVRPSRLVVVSNRVPSPLEPGAIPAAGGLVAALLPALQREGGLWLGWSGREGDPAAPPLHRRDSPDGTVAFVTLDLTAEDVRDYYQGFCNQLLWPLMHGFIDHAAGDPPERWYEAYRSVNRRLADALVPLLGPGDLVWVQDYHLIPLGDELRGRGWRGALGYFHHIPIPTTEVWSAIPHVRELAGTFAAYDLVGVQTKRDAGRLRAHLETALDARALAPAARPRVGGYPISIDPARVRQTASRHPGNPFAAYAGERQVVLGVDRLDYSKGIPQRLEAYGSLLADDESVAFRSMLVQWAAPSRAGIPQYEAERDAVQRLGAELASRFGEASVHLELATLSPETIAAGLRDADVCLVTSPSDGMNLVAKEFVAAQEETRPGVLVLSDGCGAAEELLEALIVPAGDVRALERAIARALDMPPEERYERWRALSQRVESHTVHGWRRGYLEDLAAAAAARLRSSM